MLNRRNFLATTGAATLMPSVSLAQEFQLLEPRPINLQLAPPEFATTEVWSYGSAVPGPEIRVMQGERVQRQLINGLPQPTSVHWHGIRIENAMDGVAGLTQAAVEPNEAFDYDFAAPDAGTYWYHAHNRSMEQVARGLYGALIVQEPMPPEVDRDETLIIDDWLLDPETAQIDPDFGASHALSHGGRTGNYIVTNGTFRFASEVRVNERLRLRVINTANARIFEFGLAGLDGWVVALDGMPLLAPVAISENLVLGPGQRADLIVDVIANEGDTAHLVRFDRQAESQAAFPVAGLARMTRLPAPLPLPQNSNHQLPDLGSAVTAGLVMEGGAMGRMSGANYQGRDMNFRQLAAENQFWALNGKVGMTESPLLEVGLGQSVLLQISNETSFPHAMHLHGMHFREVLSGGTMGPMRDTLLSPSGDKHEIAFVANNPGDWLFHCHMLSHAASGMTTWLKVRT